MHFNLLTRIEYFLSRIFIACFLLLGLNACTGSQGAIYESLKLTFTNPNTTIDSYPLDPRFTYLRADVNGNPALLVLGYVDPQANGLIEVWYSSSREAVRIQNGRLSSTHGLDINWTEVKLIDAPPISAALDPKNIEAAELATTKIYRNLKNPLSYTRIRTVMPGYRAQIEEVVLMKALSEAPSDAPKRLKEGPYSANLRWVEERVSPKYRVMDNPGLAPITAIYAIDVSTPAMRPIYGRQCLMPSYCLSWQVWPWPPVARTKS